MKFGLREIFLLLVLLAMPVSSYWLVFRPQNAEITRVKQEIEHKKSLLEKLKEQTSRANDLQRLNGEYKTRIDEIEARLPTNKEVDGIVRQVSDLAVEAGLEPPSMKSLKPVKAALYMEQPLEIELRGDFVGFHQFLVKLEQLPRITRVPDIRLERDDKENGHMKAAFTLSIYFQDPEALASSEPVKELKSAAQSRSGKSKK